MATFISKLISEPVRTTEVNTDSIFNNVCSGLKDIDCEDIGISEVTGLIAGKFTVDFKTSKLEQFSTPQADAYSATGADNSSNHYCLTFKKDMPIRLAEIITLKAVLIPGLISPLEIEIAGFSESEEKFLCVICEKPKGKTLKEWVRENRRFSKGFILKKIIDPINKVLLKLHKTGVVHGQVNPSTIYLDENDEIILGECISSLTGLMQPNAYEVINRAQSHKYGKGSGDKSIDYYALGMTIFSITSGIFFEDLDHIDIVESKLQEGSFNLLKRHSHFSGTIGDLLNGLVIDDKNLRWGFKEVENIIMDGSYTVPSLVDKSILPRPIPFKEKEHFSKAALAHHLAKNWEEAKVFIKQAFLLKWLDISIHEQVTIEALERLQELVNMRGSKYALFSKEDEHLIKLIILLDPEGPIRYKEIAVHIEGIGPLLSYSMLSQENELTQFIANGLFIDLFSFYDQVAAWLQNNSYSKGLPALKQASSYIRKGGYGFGMERCCYDLNASLPCQSHVLGKGLVYGLRSALKYIDGAKVSIEELLSKKNFLCFIASKINLNDDLKVTKLRSFYALDKDKTFISLAILSIAQKKADLDELKNLGELYAEKVKVVLEEAIKGETIKKNIFTAIDKVKSEGNLNLIKHKATDVNYLEQDAKGFIIAANRVITINNELEQLKSKQVIEQTARKRGLKIAVNISYIIAALSIILGIIKRL